MDLTRGERFQDARVTHNKNGAQSAREVSAATGIADTLIGDLENDEKKRSVGYDKIVILAKHYGVSIDYLLGLTSEPTNNKDVAAVCEYTGMAYDAVEFLHNEQDPQIRLFYRALFSCLARIPDYAKSEIVKLVKTAAEAQFVNGTIPVDAQEHSDKGAPISYNEETKSFSFPARYVKDVALTTAQSILTQWTKDVVVALMNDAYVSYDRVMRDGKI